MELRIIGENIYIIYSKMTQMKSTCPITGVWSESELFVCLSGIINDQIYMFSCLTHLWQEYCIHNILRPNTIIIKQ
jgi:hypothetical protein